MKVMIENGSTQAFLKDLTNGQAFRFVDGASPFIKGPESITRPGNFFATALGNGVSEPLVHEDTIVVPLYPSSVTEDGILIFREGFEEGFPSVKQ